MSKKVKGQLSFDVARRPDGEHGGWRPNAGRKKKPGSISHDARAELSPHHPQHVTLRIAADVGSIAKDWLMKRIRGAIKDSQKQTFRIVDFNVLANHLHLMIEAANKRARSTGMQGLEVRLAQRLNAALKRTGSVLAHRYHARALKTPRDVRNVLRYILLNRKHHDKATSFARDWIDPFSSAAWFTGWAQPVRATGWKRELLAMKPPTVPPSAWLLTTGWKRHGLLRFDEAPA